MTEPDDPILALARHLGADGGLKLWSIIVTILGDRAHAGLGDLPGPALSALIARMGLQPQAMRVALHRLRRDGWIDIRKTARIGHYALSDHGRAQTSAVAARVYDRPENPAPAMHVVILRPGAPDAAELPPALFLTRNTVLLNAGDADISGAIVTDLAAPLPDWAADLVRKAACDAGFAALDAQIRALDPARLTAPHERYAARALALHGWRRLVLTSNAVAQAALGTDAAVHACRDTVLDLLEHLPIPAVEEVAAPNGAEKR